MHLETLGLHPIESNLGLVIDCQYPLGFNKRAFRLQVRGGFVPSADPLVGGGSRRSPSQQRHRVRTMHGLHRGAFGCAQSSNGPGAGHVCSRIHSQSTDRLRKSMPDCLCAERPSSSRRVVLPED